MKTRALSFILIILTVIVMPGCKTVPTSVDENLSAIEYFQLGQEASDSKAYDTALMYYTTFIERFPDDSQKIVEAEYEIAFIYYKENELEKAGNMFAAILEKYKQPGADILPAWPKILSEKILVTIDENKQKSEEEQTESE